MGGRGGGGGGGLGGGGQIVDADYLPPEAHQTQVYKAVCLIDKRRVLPAGK